MKKVEASTLEEAYQKAATQLSCSVIDLEYEVIQYPSSGILGFFKKKAIIVAVCNTTLLPQKEIKENLVSNYSNEEHVASEIISMVTEDLGLKNSSTEKIPEKNAILDNFFESNKKTVYDEPEAPSHSKDMESSVLAQKIENQLKELFSHTCFEIDIIEVDVRNNMALIFLDGNDAALLIGKEGYRYNALSYILFNWIHSKYELFIKLEIAEFLTTQQEVIRHYLKPLIATIEKKGKGKTRFLDGILVQIALEQLREEFPNKYVAVKTVRDGKKFVVVNPFNNRNKINV